MGIKLKTADISAVKRDASARRPAKPRYKNSHLPFQDPIRDLLTWRNAVLPSIIDWAGTLDEPFAINSHPDLHDIIEQNWNEQFPAVEADDAVQAVVSQNVLRHRLLLMSTYLLGKFSNPQLEKYHWEARSPAAHKNFCRRTIQELKESTQGICRE